VYRLILLPLYSTVFFCFTQSPRLGNKRLQRRFAPSCLALGPESTIPLPSRRLYSFVYRSSLISSFEKRKVLGKVFLTLESGALCGHEPIQILLPLKEVNCFPVESISSSSFYLFFFSIAPFTLLCANSFPVRRFRPPGTVNSFLFGRWRISEDGSVTSPRRIKPLRWMIR